MAVALNQGIFAADPTVTCAWRCTDVTADDKSLRASAMPQGRGPRDVNSHTLQESAVPAESALVAPMDLVDTSAVLVPEYSNFGRTAADELVNTVTHGFGFLMAVVGAQAMLSRLAGHNDRWLVAGCLMYLFGLLSVYAMSTLSHGATSAKWKSTISSTRSRIHLRVDRCDIHTLLACVSARAEMVRADVRDVVSRARRLCREGLFCSSRRFGIGDGAIDPRLDPHRRRADADAHGTVRRSSK